MILRAGSFNLRYENGEIRGLKWGETEVLNRVYGAVRDQNWGTIPPQILGETVEDFGDSFRVRFEARHAQNEVEFEWRGEISGARDGSLEFVFDGEAKSNFWRNRIGLCVLHPMSVAGAKTQIETPDGARQTGEFPVELAPHQPFLNLKSLAHEVVPGLWARVEFGGEIFETEDQRNWSDASFKTYGTPLERPFPVRIQNGERIFQKLRLSFEQSKVEFARASNRAEDRQFPSISAENARKSRFPLGFALPVTGPIPPRAIELLRQLQPAHLRVDGDWQTDFSPAIQSAKSLDCPLEIAFFLGDCFGETEFKTAITTLKTAPISAFCLFGSRVGPIEKSVFEAAAKTVRAAFPGVPVGAGSNANFVELNRNRPDLGCDFVVFASNPQVHAFDDESILETPATLGPMLQTARKIAGGQGVKISPLTFEPRFNAVATDKSWAKNGVNDARLFTPLAALWAQNCLATLEKNGLGEHPFDSLTLLETHGPRGIVGPQAEKTPVWEALKNWREK